jgi:hypothetical protein
MFSLIHNFDDRSFTNSRAEWIPDEPYPSGPGVGKGARRVWRCDFFDVGKVIAIRPPNKTLKITGTCVLNAGDTPSFKDVWVEIIPETGKNDEWQLGEFFIKVVDARIVDCDKSKTYTLPIAEEEIRRVGYEYASGCWDCSDEDSSPKDVLESWMDELAGECLTEGEPDLCEKYWSTIDFDKKVDLFRDGLEQYFNEHFIGKEDEA